MNVSNKDMSIDKSYHCFTYQNYLDIIDFMKINVLLLILFLYPQILFAYCSEPSTPFGRPYKPNTPYCINEFSKTHTCDEWEFNNYVNDMENYRFEVENYIRELNNYLQDARDFVECEVRALELN